MITKNATQALALQMVANERARQDAKWGSKNILNRSGRDGLVVMMEEVGEVARALLEGKDYRTELVQVAAVAVAMLESFRSETGECLACEVTGLEHDELCRAQRQQSGAFGSVTFRQDFPTPGGWYRWEWCRCSTVCPRCNGTGYALKDHAPKLAGRDG